MVAHAVIIKPSDDKPMSRLGEILFVVIFVTSNAWLHKSLPVRI